MIVLSEADYYRYSAPFRQWLYDTHARQLSDYKTVEAKRIFAQDFVSVWNARRLPGTHPVPCPLAFYPPVPFPPSSILLRTGP